MPSETTVAERMTPGELLRRGRELVHRSQPRRRSNPRPPCSALGGLLSRRELPGRDGLIWLR